MNNKRKWSYVTFIGALAATMGVIIGIRPLREEVKSWFYNEVQQKTRFEDVNAFHILLLPFGESIGTGDVRQYHWALESRLRGVIGKDNLNAEVIKRGVLDKNPAKQTVADFGAQLEADLVIWGNYQEYPEAEEVLLDVNYLVLNHTLFKGPSTPERILTLPTEAYDALKSGSLKLRLDAIVYFCLGQLEFYEENYEKARKYFELAENEGDLDDQADFHSVSGYADYLTGHYEDAFDSYFIVNNLRPNNQYVLLNLGVFARKSGRVVESTVYFNEAISLDSTYFKAYTGRGLSYFRLDSVENAINDFETALSYEPNDHVTLNNLSDLYYRQKAYSKAILKINQAIELESDDIDYIILRHAINKELGNRPQVKLDSLQVAVYLKNKFGIKNQDSLIDLTRQKLADP